MRFARILLPVLAVLVALHGFAHAQNATPTQTIAVYGDSLGDGVWSGLYNLLRAHPEVKLLRRAKIGAGLTRPDYAQWFADLKTELEAEHIDAAVVMFGANDQQNIRDDNHKGHLFQSDGWRTVYGARIDAILRLLGEHKIRTVWLGLPVMRKDELNAGARYLDEIFAGAAKANNATFLPLLADFGDAEGAFTLYMNDAAGRSRQVRAEDGVHFTGYGYELVAAKVLHALDLANRADVAKSN